MSNPTIHDYDPKDGWDDGSEQCPHCETTLTLSVGAVYNHGGVRYDTIYESEAGKGPYFCEECFEELERNRRANENQAITEFVQ